MLLPWPLKPVVRLPDPSAFNGYANICGNAKNAGRKREIEKLLVLIKAMYDRKAVGYTEIDVLVDDIKCVCAFYRGVQRFGVQRFFQFKVHQI